MVPVVSTAIAAVGYDEAARRLYVRFLDSGATYAYLGVPPSEHAALMTAESKGTFVNTRIKPRYRYEPAG